MTDVMSRPILRVQPTSEPPRRPLALMAATACVGAASVGVVGCVALTVGAWFTGASGSFGGAIKVGVLAWLLAVGGGLHLASATITAVPVGALLGSAYLLYRGGRWAGARSAVRTFAAAARGASVMGAVFCAAGLAGYAVTASGQAHADLARTALATASAGTVFGGLGVLQGADLWAPLLDKVPVEGRATLRGAVVGVGTLLTCGAALVAGSLVAHFSTAVRLAEGMHTGVVGGIVLTVAGLAVVPNAAMYAVAFAAGPGFALGTGTSVAPGGVTLGRLPAFPLLASAPRHVTAWWLPLLVVVPLAAGVLAGLAATRRHPVTEVGRLALRGGLAGLLTGVSAGALTWLASGAVGPGRMADVGPDVVGTLVVCVVAGVLGGATVPAGRQWVRGALDRRGSTADGR